MAINATARQALEDQIVAEFQTVFGSPDDGGTKLQQFAEALSTAIAEHFLTFNAYPTDTDIYP